VERPSLVLSIDIVFFNKANGIYGHDIGDVVIQIFTEMMKNNGEAGVVVAGSAMKNSVS
jgi:GGDEF domain-containing protein